MSDTPMVTFSSVDNPNTWNIEGESKCLVFASPSEAKRAEELFTAMLRAHAAERERADRLMRLAYLAGWNASGEGYNAEYPFGDSDMDPEADAKWIAVRDTALDAARRK